MADILFSWEPKSYKDRVLKLQINYMDYRNISMSNQGFDSLEFKIYEQQKILSRMFKPLSKSSINKPFLVHLPPQWVRGTLTKAADVAVSTTVIQSVTLVIFNIGMGKSVQEVWGMLNSMQIVLHLGAMRIPIPGNVYYVQQ